MKKNRRFILVLVALVLLFVGSEIIWIRPVNAGYWETAYDVKKAYSDPWWNPHYGAFFNGTYGSQQYFTGDSGEPPGYSDWDWWGTGYNVLLLDKTWLFTTSDAWNGSNHHAYMAYQ